jgi:hypothetical protein
MKLAGLIFLLNLTYPMNDLKQFNVSCWNSNTEEIIYHDQLVDAPDDLEARRKADEVQKKCIAKLPVGTERRYVITPIED